MPKPLLSKSSFLRGLQCEKSLYLHKHHYDWKDPISPAQQAIFDRGSKVGLLAQDLFPDGVDASPESYYNMQESVQKTKDFIESGKTVIYEATFMYDDVIAALDILVKDEDGWKAFEVKSSTEVSETYIQDATIQYYTIKNSGIDLKDISIVYINNKYVRNGELELHQLFNVESVLEEVLKIVPDIPDEVTRLKHVIKSPSIPDKDIGLHCFDPYECDFKGTCWKHLPEYSIFNISKLQKKKKFKLYNNGIITFEEVYNSEVILNEKQTLQVNSEVEGTTQIDEVNIRNFVDKLEYPLYFLDFETLAPAIPLYNNSRPYQKLVFQYSLHIQEQPGGELMHKEYLANPDEDPRNKFVEQIIKDCGESGDIIVYNISFERGRLNDLIEVFPEYQDQLTNIINRLKDLMIPFREKWYYTPEMKGSYSIKYVLPALVPELSYNDLDIKEGGTASNTYLSMAQGNFEGDIEKTREHLIEYCKLDTLAMVKILEVLRKV